MRGIVTTYIGPGGRGERLTALIIETDASAFRTGTDTQAERRRRQVERPSDARFQWYSPVCGGASARCTVDTIRVQHHREPVHGRVRTESVAYRKMSGQ
jgi:hypothetical protein